MSFPVSGDAAAALPRPERHPAPHREAVPIAKLWYGVFGAPLAWSLQELYGYAAMAHGCYPRRFPLSELTSAGWWWSSVIVSIVTVAIGAGALVTAIRNWERTREEKPGRHTEALEIGEGRTRFMSISGVMLAAFFLLASLLTGAALVVLPACGR
jgi:hypothetical protein